MVGSRPSHYVHVSGTQLAVVGSVCNTIIATARVKHPSVPTHSSSLTVHLLVLLKMRALLE